MSRPERYRLPFNLGVARGGPDVWGAVGGKQGKSFQPGSASGADAVSGSGSGVGPSVGMVGKRVGFLGPTTGIFIPHAQLPGSKKASRKFATGRVSNTLGGQRAQMLRKRRERYARPCTRHDHHGRDT